MSTKHSFVLHNNMDAPLLLNIEPEAVLYPLRENEKVTVRDEFVAKPVTLTLSRGENHETILSLWPGDGEMIGEKDGEDVLDLAAACSAPADS